MKPIRGAWICAFLSLVGIGLAGYLTFLHLGVVRGEFLGGPACTGASEVFNCHAVTAGPWGSLLGMPLSLWGILGYLIVLGLSLWSLQSAEAAQNGLALIAVVAAGFFIIDLVLLGVMMFVIKVYCLFCMLTYAVNLCLLGAAVLSQPAPGGRLMQRASQAFGMLLPSGRSPASWLFWGMILVSATAVWAVDTATTFMNRGTLKNSREQLREFFSKQEPVDLETGGNPHKGASPAFVRLIEFSDMLCPSCQRASKMNAILLANYRNDMSLVFKHYPLDQECNPALNRNVHPGACQLAAAASCAHLQDKFWPFHDVIFAKGRNYKVSDINTDAKRLGLDMNEFQSCMQAGKGMERVRQDVAEGNQIGVSSTPTYVVNGYPIGGGISPQVFEDILAVLKESKH